MSDSAAKFTIDVAIEHHAINLPVDELAEEKAVTEQLSN